jgi:hypothetical protein
MIEQFKSDMSKWIHDWVSVYSDKMQAIPCPFAKQALINDSIEWYFVDSIYQLIEIYADFDLKKEVALIGFKKGAIDPENLAELTEDVNIDLMRRDLVALEDHPEKDEILFGENMNHGTWGFVAIQKLSKLNRASEQLARQGYYKDWPQKNYDDVVAWRFEKK